MSVILGIDAGGTLIKYAYLSADGSMDSSGSVPTPYSSKEDFLDVIRGLVTGAPGEVDGVAMSLPGTIDPKTGYVFQGGSLAYHNGLSLKSWYEQELGVPVEVENDARCAATAELREGALKGVQNGIALTFGTGVGCAIVIGGELYRGAHLFSGEISASVYGDIAAEGRGALLGSKVGVGHFCQRVCERKGVVPADGKTVFSWIAAGDRDAVEEFNAYCDVVAVELFNLQLTLDPERVAIGGGVSANPLFLAGIERALEAFYSRFPVQIPRLDVCRCEWCNDANIKGAYWNFKRMQELRGK